MFDRVVARYDLMNRLMTLGMDGAWRRAAVEAIGPVRGRRALDLGCGTGDLSIELRRAGAEPVVGLDPVPTMLAFARQKAERRGQAALPVVGDGLALPFADGAFDLVLSAFVLRNLADLPGGLREAKRVLRPGGRFASLELTPNTTPIIGPIARAIAGLVVPPLGGIVTGDRDAYKYLPASVDRFPAANGLSRLLAEVGFTGVRYRRFLLGSVALHIARRPEPPPWATM